MNGVTAMPLSGVPRCRVGVVHRAAEQQAVVAVRRAAYAQAQQFRWLDTNTLAWSADDQKATVLGLWDANGVLNATVRATVLPSTPAAQAVIAYDIEALNLPGPLMLLTRAATHPQAQCRGGNALLRCAYLAAMLHTDLGCVITQVYDQAPRLRALRQAGFELTPLSVGWDGEAQPLTQPLLAWMLRHHVVAGLQRMESEHDAGLSITLIDLPAIAASLNAQMANL